MKSLSNVGAERLGDALGESIDNGAKLSIISSYFTVFAYGELKEELSKVDELRFLFSEPTWSGSGSPWRHWRRLRLEY